MEQPPGFSVDGSLAYRSLAPEKVPVRSETSSLCMGQALNEELEIPGLVISDADPCLFVRCLKDDALFLLVWVYDILPVARNEKNILRKEFAPLDLGPVSRHLGMEVHRDCQWDPSGIMVN